MTGQNWWIITISSVLLVSATIVRSADPTELSLNQRFPNKDETEVCGNIRDVIERDSGRFRRILVRNTNDQIDYINDDARRMTSRTKSKLDVLASLVISEWSDYKLHVAQAWTDQVLPSDSASLHYEGRSVRLQTKDFDEDKLGRLAGLAIEAGFDWVEYTDSNYIRASVIPDVCQTSVDLVFVLDNSGSVGDTNFRKVKDFVKRVIDFFNIGRDGTHVAVVTYDIDTHIEFNLVRYFTKNDLRNAVDDIDYHGYLTYTGEALRDVRLNVLTAAAGMRTDDGIPKIVLLLTDGYSNGIQPYGPANDLRNTGVSIFCIGVGLLVSVSELNGIASDPDKDYVFRLSSFNQLASFVDRVSSVSCGEGSLIDSCKVAETTVESGSFKYFRTTFSVVTNKEVSIEVRDTVGISHLYASDKSRNPGPLDPDSVKNEADTSPKAVSLKLDGNAKTVYVAVQGQQDNNKFSLSFWDNLFESRGVFEVNVTEEQDAREILTLNMLTNPDTLEYSISAGDDTSAFSVVDSSPYPKLSTKRKLDYEVQQEYSIVIEAVDSVNQCYKSRAMVQVNVIDKNDNPPTFSKTEYIANIAENAQKGVSVIKLVATDLDSGDNGKITYTFVSSTSPAGLFNIDASTGDVTLQGILDYEAESSYNLTALAKDSGSPSLSSTVVLRIFVTDINEQPSVDCVGGCVRTISEAAQPGTKVGELATTDPDTGVNCALQYSMPGIADEKFRVASNGEILTKANLDRETNPQYIFYITVKDCGSPPLTDRVRVTITVTDVNDNRPQFPGPYNEDMYESESSGSTVVQVKATDADEGLNAEIKYRLVDGTDASAFKINENDGTITIVSKLDYETKTSYSFTVIAQDQGPGDSSGSTTVTVNVIDVNDNAPAFLGTPYVAVIKENAGTGTPVINVNATDSDSGPAGKVKYFIISGNIRNAFAIHEDTGLITVNTALDQETTPSYTLFIQAKDSGSPSLQSQVPVIITVKDTNDNIPVFQGLPYSASVPEDFGTVLPVLKVSATDDDAGVLGQITYRIDSTDDSKDTFTIDDQGNIRVKTSLDYETKEEYSFKVVAKDGGNATAEAPVTVYVTDVNDHEPLFDKNPYVEFVDENLPPNRVINTVNARDEDSGQRGSVTYSIIDGNIGNAFTINAQGQVIALISFDRETREFYNLTIQAKDGGSPAKSSTTQMDITIRDKNDNTPTFGETFFRFSISENNEPDEEVGEFGPATDKDKGANAEIVYTILSGNIDNDFEYDGATGKLKAKNVLDRERTSVYTLGVKAADNGSPSRSSTVVVQIVVLDQNDNAPVFSKDPYNCEIDENSAANSLVCSVSATDKDDGVNSDVTYELVAQSSTFKVDKDTGEITALVTFDRENISSYSFDIIAKDAGSPSKNSTVTVNVKVLDQNDNEPRFTQSSYSFEVSEDAQVKTKVGEVLAKDNDEGLNGKVEYSIIEGNAGTAFSINSTSGVITVASGLDRETLASYRLIVRATDGGTPSQFSSREVVITVTDVNDNDPVFTADPYQGIIAEDASVDSRVVQVKATDADEGVNSEIKYSITAGGMKEHFKIDEDSGFITTATELDYQLKKSYLLTVTATDGGDPQRSNTAHVNITVENVDDPTIFILPPPFVRVSEAIAVGTNILRLNATDKDGNRLSFSIKSGNIENTFAIDEATGVLSTNASLDRETIPTYNLTVAVSDQNSGAFSDPALSGGEDRTHNLTVIVTDENDNGPIFNPSSYSANVTENADAGVVVTVTATDKDEGDNAKITYSIDSVSKKTFNINPTTGEISVIGKLDYENGLRYEITVTAKDSGTPSLSSTAKVVVMVEDLNDNHPNFPRDYSTSLRENTAEGAVIRVEASDPDSGVNGKVVYKIISGDDDGFFMILNGIITVAKPPDRERNSSFILIINASNPVPVVDSAPSAKTTATVSITISDVNDNAPVITNTETSVEIPENSAMNTEVIDVDAIDNDLGDNSKLEYEIVDGNIGDVFVINPTTGLVKVSGTIDRETRESYTLRIRVSDKGSPSLSSEKEFLVNVTDLNDNAPEFTAEPYVASVSEAANISTFVIQVKASDKDTAANGRIKFTIVSGNSQTHFRIDAGTGNIFTNALLDFETIPEYTLLVRAEDTTHSVEANVTIRLVNINDNDPIFNPALYAMSIAENWRQGDEFLTLTATDKDDFGGLTYTIVSGNTDSKFDLEPASGKLLVAGGLDRETTDFYNLTVRVTDGGVPARSDTAYVEITITDINDNPPRFNTSRVHESVVENSRVGTPVLTVKAEDKDIGMNGEVSYEIINGNDAGLFKLGESSGVLTVNGAVDRETITNFRLEIIAKDKGIPLLQSSTLIVIIDVLDANDNSPKFTEDSYTRSISETSSNGSFVEEVQAMDADIGVNAKVVYSLLNGTEYFKIENETGVISTIVELDREKIPSFIILVFVKDLGTPSRNATTSLTVTVLDANDNAPLLNRTLYANVIEEKPKGQFVIQLVATDADDGANAIVEYDLETNAKQFLDISTKNGTVTTLVPFDFEAQRNYTFKVIASDKGNPSLSTTATLYINVLDTDDNCPEFNPKEYNVTIEENLPLDQTIVQVKATDVDTVGEETLQYGIRKGDTEGFFFMGATSGEITSRKFVNREGPGSSEFNLVVRAGNDFCGVNISDPKDEFVNRRLSSSIAYVNIFVTDQNDNAPKFTPDSYQHTLTDIYSSSLLRLHATDSDEGVNAEFDFGLHGVTRNGAKRTLIVTATDKGVPTQTSNTTVEVTAENCEALKFSVSARGNVSVQTLCSVNASMSGKDLIGESVTLSCIATGNTIPEYRWTKGDSEVKGFNKSGEYKIDSLRKDNAGVYTCYAASEAGNIVSRTIIIYARESVKISVPPKDTPVEVGRKATLSCRATGDKPISFSWYKNGVELQSNAEINYNQQDLVFDVVFATDEGRYVCKVTNDYGTDESVAAVLQVYAESAIVELDINVNNPRVDENCQFFNISAVTETLNGLIDGSVRVVEFEQPKGMCNITACSSNPCRNQGTCRVRGSSFDCQCPGGWSGDFCEKDPDECQICRDDVCTPSNETCKNNGKCVNRPGSFFCTCPNSNITGKLCEFDRNKVCQGQCEQGETCYPKDNNEGFECLANARAVSMVYQLDSNQIPFEDWMKYDVAQNIRNAINSNGNNEVSQDVAETRKRRATETNQDYGACSVRVLDGYEVKGSTLDLTVILVCQNSPDQTFICNALLAEGTVQSCTGNDNKVLVKEKTTNAPTLSAIPVMVVFIARDKNNKETTAAQIIDTLKSKNVYEKLQKDGMVVTDLRARSTPKTSEDSGLPAGVIAGIVVAVVLLFLIALVIIFVVIRTRRDKDRDFSIGVRAILAPRSKKHKQFGRSNISMNEIKAAEIRGMSNDMFSTVDEQQQQHHDSDGEDGSFMVQIPKSVSKTNIVEPDYMSELETAPWFHGSISRTKAENILATKETDGLYLVRSGLDKGEFYISMTTSQDEPKYRHVAVNRHDGCFVAICGPETEAMQFTTFNELLEYLRSTPTHLEGTERELLLKDYIGKDGN